MSARTHDPADVRGRVLEATARCAMKYSLQRTTVEDISRESGVSRATVYRHFPGGRDEIISAAVHHQVDAFFIGLAHDVGDAGDLEDLVVRGLMAAHRRLASHELFHRVMAVEPEIVVPLVSTESSHVLGLITTFLRPRIAAAAGRDAGRDDVELDRRAEDIARLFLSHVETPGSWDLTDEQQVRTLVTTQFLQRSEAHADR